MNLELISFEWNENMCIFRCGTYSHKQASLKVQHRNDEKFLTHSCESSICKLNLSISLLTGGARINTSGGKLQFSILLEKFVENLKSLSRRWRWRRSHQPRMCVGYNIEYDDDGFVFLCIFSCINFSLHKFPILSYSLRLRGKWKFFWRRISHE